jgi:uncharacterized protein with LGFP repeats
MTWVKAADKVVWQWGRVLAHYDGQKREKSVLGMPASDTWGKRSYRGARYVNGVIVWSKASGAHHVWGSFDAAYMRQGGVKGSLGLPLTRRDGKNMPGAGRRQRFTDGTLYLNPDGHKVFALWGPVDVRYRKMGAAKSKCGYPVSNTTEQGSEHRAEFANGAISWSESGGVKVEC